ncbi:hypothetical protein ARMGADRAFT_1035075 [Armillaria gallica]|uniref:F-box domain-containing protein n=1 Tax=Armillaria gallica TaxID=47427 RepID=A0A2H3CVX8_ARMGA|nr:hypothetical protein ARMGADRAFT_1035075 [Armillaria gallica]
MHSNQQHCALEDLPPELLQQILSLLNILTLKWLSLASSILRASCLPYIFRAVFLYGPTSYGIFIWKSFSVIRSGNVHNMDIIPLLSVLRDLELSRFTFQIVEDYFKLLANLPPTLKKLAVQGIRFRLNLALPLSCMLHYGNHASAI